LRTVPLHGKIAAGRVAFVDDEDHDLVMQFRWNVYEITRPGRHPLGPYAVTPIYVKGVGTRTTLKMHNLIMRISGVDHVNHNGLDNQRTNLRPATDRQQHHNQRGRLGSASGYKGVSWNSQRQRWQAGITVEGKRRHLGFYVSEMEAALAYDDAAPGVQGEYAFLNFPEGVPQEVRDHLRAEREAIEAAVAAEGKRVHDALVADWWAKREPTPRTCQVCDKEYLSRSLKPTFYCSDACNAKAKRQRDREKRLEVSRAARA
jgi:hypothetical protein